MSEGTSAMGDTLHAWIEREKGADEREPSVGIITTPHSHFP